VQGYTEGLQQGKAEFAEAALCLSQRYNEASKAAEQEAKELAVLLAEQVIETHIGQCSEPLSRSLHQAAELLRSTTPHVLLIHPRLEKIVSQVSHSLPTGIRTEVNRTPGAPDFILVGESGAVEFAWRSALKAVTESR
jgi:flagellar biosynthesis/type III secretory pathway protein FliH